MLVYLDHSIINQMLKSQPGLSDSLGARNIVVVYSDANLQEISLSVGWEHKFLTLLEALGARYLRLIVDAEWRSTDRAVIEDITPAAAYDAFVINQRESPTGDVGLSNLLQKFYGGYTASTFGDLAAISQQEFGQCLDALANDLETTQLPPGFNGEDILRQLPEMRKAFAAVASDMGVMLDANATQNQVRAIDSALHAGPKDLNNLEGPDILRKVWERIAPEIPEGSITFDELFGLVRLRWSTDRRPLSRLEQINGAYGALNVLGYWRDKRLDKGVGGHLRDTTHVGMASFCNLFLSGDERQAKKARAVYEHLGIGTYVKHIPPP